MKTLSKLLILGFALTLMVMYPGTSASATVIAIGPNDFLPGTTVITFDGINDGTEVNGLTVGGVLFSYSIGNGQVITDGGPGQTNNINPPNVVSIGDPTGTMKLSLPGLTMQFGYGYALDTGGPVAGATTIALYAGNAFVGSLSYDGDNDPTFTGGFAGIQSDIAFDTAYLTFNTNAAPAWAFDNVMYAPAVPEPGTLLMFASGFLGVAGLLRKRFLA